MESYNKNEIEKILNSNLVIHWWNCGSKTLDFNGTVKEYLDNLKVKYTIKTEKTEFCERLSFTVKFQIGSLQKISFTTGRFEDVIRMVVNTKLTYLGDKSRYTLLGRTRNFTY
jgi:hypothetical protein